MLGSEMGHKVSHDSIVCEYRGEVLHARVHICNAAASSTQILDLTPTTHARTELRQHVEQGADDGGPRAGLGGEAAHLSVQS